MQFGKYRKGFQKNLECIFLDGIMALWEWMGSGVPSGLQNQYKELGASWVGSIPTLSRQSITKNRLGLGNIHVSYNM